MELRWMVINAVYFLTFFSVVEGSVPPTPKVNIDGYTVSSTLNSSATLPLGTTLILVCRLSGIPHGQHTTYTWTCPNTPCQQTGYAGRKINNNIIAINTTSTSDGGTYTCTVTAGGVEASQQFQLKVPLKQKPFMHSYGRLIARYQVITDLSEVASPENSTPTTGRITCTQGVWYCSKTDNIDEANRIPLNTNKTVHQTIEPDPHGNHSMLVISEKPIQHASNMRFMHCKHFKFTNKHTMFVVLDGRKTIRSLAIEQCKVSKQIIELKITNYTGEGFIGYTRLDLGAPLSGRYEKLALKKKTLGGSGGASPLVPGATYRITVWGYEGKNKSLLSTVLTVKTKESNPSPPRELTITRVFQHGIELNWIPPRETNGDIQHYIIKYSPKEAAEQEINTTDNTNYYNLTGLVRGKRYKISIVAVNTFASEPSRPSFIYIHEPPKPKSRMTTTWQPSPAITVPAATPSTTPGGKPHRFDPGPIVGGSVAGVVLLTVVVGVLSLCAATRKWSSPQQKTTPTTHPYYRMSMGGLNSEQEEQQYARLQYEGSVEGIADHTHIIHHYEVVGDFNEESGRVNTNCKDGRDKRVIGLDKAPLYANVQGKETRCTAPMLLKAAGYELGFSKPDQHRNRRNLEEESLSSHPPESLFVQAEEVQPFPVGVSVPGDIPPSVLLLIEDTTDNKH